MEQNAGDKMAWKAAPADENTSLEPIRLWPPSDARAAFGRIAG